MTAVDRPLDHAALLRFWTPPHNTGRVWGLDIGGANLKAASIDSATGKTSTRSLPFALWRAPDRLAEHLQALTHGWAAPHLIAVTMTGEIADCFSSKSHGVATIVEQCEAAFQNSPATCHYYAPSADAQSPRFVSAAVATNAWPRIAASNWHAVARVWGQWLTAQQQAPGLILDLGSTTLDLTPIPLDEEPPQRTDWQRICRGELLYTGCRRSPLAAVLSSVNIDADIVPLAQELFATIGDAYLVTGDRPEAPTDTDTADGRPATVNHAKQRLARMFCSDTDELPTGWLERLANAAKRAHLNSLTQAISRSLQQHPHTEWCLLLGEGEPLLRQAWEQVVATNAGGYPEPNNQSINRIAAADVTDPTTSSSMPAYAVALLAMWPVGSGPGLSYRDR